MIRVPRVGFGGRVHAFVLQGICSEACIYAANSAMYTIENIGKGLITTYNALQGRHCTSGLSKVI